MVSKHYRAVPAVRATSMGILPSVGGAVGNISPELPFLCLLLCLKSHQRFKFKFNFNLNHSPARLLIGLSL